MRAYLDDTEELLAASRVDGPWALRLDVGLPPGRDHLDLPDPDNYSYPLADPLRDFSAGVGLCTHSAPRRGDRAVSVNAGKMLRVNPAWIAVIGTAAGAGVTGIVGIAKAVVDAVSARSQRTHEAAQAKAQRDAEKDEKDAQREHERITALRKARAEQIAYWRDGLNRSALAYQRWANIYDNERQRQKAIAEGVFVPNIVGDAWFQSLRPHLPDRFRTQSVLRCDAELVVELGDEINRVQREWPAEGRGQ